MFDWFWEFLYSLTAAMCRLIDGIMQCANKLCGIDTIKVDGEETDFLTYLISSDEIRLAFAVASIIGLILVIFFSIYAIVRNVAKGKVDDSPARICMKALKAILTFMLVPACMLTLMWSLNIMMKVMYQATLNGSADGIGAYLIGAFSDEGTQLPSGVEYWDADSMWSYFNLKKYQFFFSWITCFVIVIQTAKSLILFVDRAISIVILFVVSPFSISATVLDDGAHFKLWRDQILVKFLNGYGTIIALNIYAMICALVSRPDVIFFDGDFVNFLMKVLIIVGGAFSLQRIMGLIGNLVAAGAGTQEMQQAAMANQGFKSMLNKMGNAVKTVTGINAGVDILGGAVGNLKKSASEAISGKISGKTAKDNKKAEEAKAKQEQDDKDTKSFRSRVLESLGSTNGNGKSENKAKDAISGESTNNGSSTEKDNGNHNTIGDALNSNVSEDIGGRPSGAEAPSAEDK